MNRFMRAVSLLLVLCFAATLFGVVSFAHPEDPEKQDFDPYIYAWNSPYAEPETVKEGLPEYYIPYTVRLQHISPHYVSIGNTFQNALTACVFNLVNYEMLVQDENKPLYFSEIMYTDNGCTAEEDPRAQTAANMDGFYQYLLSLPGEKAEEIAVHEDSLSVLSMLAAADLDGTALTVLVNVDATIDGDDDMTLTASVGNQSAEISLTEENKLSNDNVYAITVSGLDDASLTADSSVSLSLNGIQSLDSVF